ncbi:VWA domain-containing protein [Polaribacter ponticola]|uniref:VWA domain-containing protein n=1 Tax=Polaribacter ponticola TaxID=2978475 RepID=A0ABT5S7B3_9FLAO|nr:VWA domain-containing protein [Polaribacter sp. MSW5]MDD7913985.1 VWA domain-containing protein [Polaribacter sp. MSW5]
MQTTTIIYFFGAILFSLGVSWLLYFYKSKELKKIDYFLFSLRAISTFLLLLLLINPKIEKIETENEKPTLALLIDNSKSIKYFKEVENVEKLVSEIHKDNSLNKKFTIDNFTFGEHLKVLDSLTFLENETNISKTIKDLNELNKDKIAPIFLITDGNQTIGEDYEYLNSKQPIYPIVIGDTAKYVDVKITQLNVNKYSYIKNKFPVEAILNYEGIKKVNTLFSIFYKGKVVFKKEISFSADNNFKTVNANLTSTKEGLQYYSATLRKIDNEKNITNNKRNFSVEVIDEQTKVLILSSILHPDLGLLKKSIESNKQRSVDVFLINKFKKNINDYQLVVLYQLNNKFNKIASVLKQNNSNYLIISGTNTDWSFTNKLKLGFRKNAINQTENYGAIYNDRFLTFLQEDIGFSNYPPLKDKFGEIIFSKKHETLLYQNINGVQTKQPLLSTFDINNQKSAVLFGEGIWKWRSNSFLSSNSFEEFDKFIGSLVQFLASNKKRDRLEVNSDNIYPANSTINISAFYTDKNYQFDSRASLEIAITNKESKVVTKFPFSLVNNSYQVELENLLSGEYSFRVSVLDQKIEKFGRFKISNDHIEEHFTNANVEKLHKLAIKSGGKLFYINQLNDLTKELLENETYYTIQKSKLKQQTLIDWKWLLFIIIILFSSEWFIRKYYGKI